MRNKTSTVISKTIVIRILITMIIIRIKILNVIETGIEIEIE